MLMFGHPGLTLGAAVLLQRALRGRRDSPVKASDGPPGQASWFDSLAGYADIRVLLIGSLLPDIIDKPVGHVFFQEAFSDGRIFSHTLLFLVLISLAGLYLYRRRRHNWLLVLSFGTFTHLVFDEMWEAPRTLFWPILGLSFERLDLSTWVSDMWWALWTDPGTYIPELAGLVILVWFGMVLLRRKKLFAFLRWGRVV